MFSRLPVNSKGLKGKKDIENNDARFLNLASLL